MNKTFFLCFLCLSFLFSLFFFHFTEQKDEKNISPLQLKEQAWSFEGSLGAYDKDQLRRGFKVYREVCSSCHSIKFVRFQSLKDLGYSDEEIKKIAAEYTIKDQNNHEGPERAGVPSDYFPSPFSNDTFAQEVFGGAVPPDLSLIAKSRQPIRGLPQIVWDILTQYSAGGPDYIYSLLTGYNIKPPKNQTILPNTYYNPYFMDGSLIRMAPPLFDQQVSYKKEAKETSEQYAKDVATFLMWTAEPHLAIRKKIGIFVFIFMSFFSILLYIKKRKIWATIDKKE